MTLWMAPPSNLFSSCSGGSKMLVKKLYIFSIASPQVIKMKRLWYLQLCLRKRVLHGITFEIGPTSAPPIMLKASTIEWKSVLSYSLKFCVKSMNSKLRISSLGELEGEIGGESVSGIVNESTVGFCWITSIEPSCYVVLKEFVHYTCKFREGNFLDDCSSCCI